MFQDGLINSFVCEANPSALAHFEAGIFGPAQVILTQDVAGELSSLLLCAPNHSYGGYGSTS
jgi:hypothetical protein